MNKQLLLLAIAGAFVTTMIAQNSHHEHQTEHEHEQEHEKQKYTCPMHPEVITDHPGSCPKCGMKLVLTEKRRTTNAVKARGAHGALRASAM